MIEPRNREKLLVFLTIAVISAFVSDHLIISPLIKLWEVQSKQITELESKITKGNRQLRKKDAVGAIWNDMKQRVFQGKESTVEKQILQSSDNWVQKSGLTLKILKPRSPIENEEYLETEFQASGQGTLEQILRFLYELENEKFSIKLIDIQLNSRDKKGIELNLDIRFSALLYNEKRT